MINVVQSFHFYESININPSERIKCKRLGKKTMNFVEHNKAIWKTVILSGTVANNTKLINNELIKRSYYIKNLYFTK